MVRLVFRPFTRLRRSICTSESLRTSTRVSPGFVLAGQRSPSFGSQHVRSRCACPDAGKPTSFASAPGMRRLDVKSKTDLPSASTGLAFAFTTPWCLVTPRLAHMLDSLVRVSRRVKWNHNFTRRKLRCEPQSTKWQPGTSIKDACKQTLFAQQGAKAQTTSHASTLLPPLQLSRNPLQGSTGSVRREKNCRRVISGTPKGLGTKRAPKSAIRSSLPTASAETDTMFTD